MINSVMQQSQLESATIFDFLAPPGSIGVAFLDAEKGIPNQLTYRIVHTFHVNERLQSEVYYKEYMSGK